MANLQDALLLIGYKTKEEQISFIKLLAYRNCFSKPIAFSEDIKSESKTPQMRRSELALASWEKSNLKDSYPNHKNNIISDAEAVALLNTQFSSLVDAFDWCLNITQLNFLRDSFDAEGLTNEKEKSGVNVARYNPKDEIMVEDLEKKYDKNGNEYKLYQLVKKIGLIDETPMSMNGKIEHIVPHACVEKFAKERIHFLEPVFQFLENHLDSKPVTIYYATNPRGLFNDEESLEDKEVLALQLDFCLPEKNGALCGGSGSDGEQRLRELLRTAYIVQACTSPEEGCLPLLQLIEEFLAGKKGHHFLGQLSKAIVGDLFMPVRLKSYERTVNLTGELAVKGQKITDQLKLTGRKSYDQYFSDNSSSCSDDFIITAAGLL